MGFVVCKRVSIRYLQKRSLLMIGGHHQPLGFFIENRVMFGPNKGFIEVKEFRSTSPTVLCATDQTGLSSLLWRSFFCSNPRCNSPYCRMRGIQVELSKTVPAGHWVTSCSSHRTLDARIANPAHVVAAWVGRYWSHLWELHVHGKWKFPTDAYSLLFSISSFFINGNSLEHLETLVLLVF